MKANLIIHNDPFRPALNKRVVPVEGFKTVNCVLFDEGFLRHAENGTIERAGAFIVLVNGEPVLQRNWNTVIEDEDLVQVIALPKGGGGGSNIGNILGAVLIAVAAFYTFGLSIAAAAAVGAVAYAGLTLLGAAVPLPTTSLGMNSRESRSPTYSLNAQGNEARLMEAIPRVYGRVKMYPDLASQPYIEYQGNEQWLYQLFCVSLGEVSIEKIMVDDVDLINFEDVQTQIINPGQAVTLFPDNVVTSDAVTGQTMLGPNEENYAVLGPFVAAPPNSVTTTLAIDVALPRGAGVVDDSGVTRSRSVSFTFERQAISDTGVPVGGWVTLSMQTLTFATSNAQLLTFKVAVPPGRYQVRGYRSSNAGTDNRTFDTLQWTGLRSYLQSQYVYPNTTLIAVAMKATNVLNNTTARKFSVIAHGKVPKWDPVNGWSAPVVDNNPAWAAADILRNEVYGRGLPTSRFNVQELYRLAQVWENRGDKFNAVFDTTLQLWDALSKVLRVGRATPIYYAGIIDFVRDEPRTIAEGMFQPANIVANSFSTTYNFFGKDTPDHVVIEFYNEETWQIDTVKCVLPGSTSNNPFKTELIGATNRDQCWREGMSMAAANRDRRRDIEFSVLTPGFIPHYNSMIRISHDVPQWGYSGRVFDLNPATGILRTSEPIVFEDDTTHVIAFMRRNGSEHGPFTIVPDPSLEVGEKIYGCRVIATQAQLNAIYVSDGVREDFTFYQCGPTERRGLRALVLSAVPDENGRIRLNCINYADSVYTAENGGNVPPPAPESNLPTIPAAPIVDRVDVLYTTTVGEQNIVATPAVGAIYYEFRARLESATSYQALGTFADPMLVVNLTPGDWVVQVRAVGRAPGPWATWTGTIAATTLPFAGLATFTATSKLFAIGLEWSYNPESLSITKAIEVWASGTNVLGNAAKLFELPYPANKFDYNDLGPGQRVYFWARVIDTAGRVGPWFNNGVSITEIASNDAEKILVILTEQITETQLSQALLEYIEDAGGASVELEALINELAAMYTIKTQLTVDGIPYLAGIGVGVENNEGVITSQILLSAQRVAFLNEVNGQRTAPVVIQGGVMYINTAMIGNGTITNAMIGNVIQSNDFVENVSGWQIRKDGGFKLSSTSPNNFNRWGGDYWLVQDRTTGVFVLEMDFRD